MKSRPILFSAPMVRALLDGTKTQTRRICKLKVRYNGSMPKMGDWSEIPCLCDYLSPGELMIADKDGDWRGYCEGGDQLCPYGAVGDQLWVRERMRRVGAVVDADDRPVSVDIQYEADKAVRLNVPYPKRLKGVPTHGQCFAYGGFREASRITLELTVVRVERLQGISEEDAKAEGIKSTHLPLAGAFGTTMHHVGDEWPAAIYGDTPQRAYGALWESINGPGSWDANPWVWALSFRRIAPGGAVRGEG